MKHEIRMAMQTQKPLVVAMVEAGKNNAETVLEHVRMKIAQFPCELREEPLRMSVSIGFTLHDSHPDYEKLLQQADQGVYEAKRNGRNQIVFFGDES